MMKKIIFIGRTGAGKTTLTRKIRGDEDRYIKTQYIDYGKSVIDTPGEYAQCRDVSSALALYSYEADVVGLLIAADDEYSIFPPNITCMVNREVIGVITKINSPFANISKVKMWLELTGCKEIFYVDSKTGEGIDSLRLYLSTEKHNKNNKKTQKTTKIS